MKCDNFLKKINLRNRQRKLNKKYEEEGLSDELLEKQVELNNERQAYDIHDPNMETYEDGKKYVQ